MLLALLYGGAELGLRTVLGNWGIRQVIGHSHDARICQELRPGADGVYTGWLLRIDRSRMSVNSRGGRGAEPASEATGYRIVALGDSFTFGQGVNDDEAFPAVVGRELTAQGHDVEVLNFGVPGHGVVNAVTLLRRRLLDLEPDLVLLTHFADEPVPHESECGLVSGAVEAELRASEASGEQLPPPMGEPIGVKLGHVLYVPRAIRTMQRIRGAWARGDWARSVRQRRGTDPGAPLPRAAGQRLEPPSPVDVPWVVAYGNRWNVPSPSAPGPAHQQSPDDLRNAGAHCRTTRAALAEFAALGAEHGFVPVVALLTSGPSVRPGADCPGCAPLFELMEGTGVHGLDVGPVWAAMGATYDRHYLVGEGHLTVEGNARVAEAVADALAPMVAE